MVTLINNTISKPVPIPPKHTPVFSNVSVNDVTIPEHEILLEAQNHQSDSPGEALQSAARALTVRELLLQRADTLEIVAIPETRPDGSTECIEDAQIRHLLARELSPIDAAEGECRRYYENNKSKFRTEPIVEARHILLSSKPDENSQRCKSFQTATRLCDELARNPDKFGLLARNYSDCPSRENRGELGQLTHGSTVPEFWSAVLAMREGDISKKPVQSRYGYHIIALDRKIGGKQLPFEAVEERLAAWLEARNWSSAVKRYISQLASVANITGTNIETAEGPYSQ